MDLPHGHASECLVVLESSQKGIAIVGACEVTGWNMVDIEWDRGRYQGTGGKNPQNFVSKLKNKAAGKIAQ